LPSPPVNWTSGGDTLTILSKSASSRSVALQVTASGPAWPVRALGLNRGIRADVSAESGQAVVGVAGNTLGSGVGVYGFSSATTGSGVFGQTSTPYGYGVRGESSGTYGVGVFASVSTPAGYAILAEGLQGGRGVEARSSGAVGIQSWSNWGLATTNLNTGVSATANGSRGRGVYGRVVGSPPSKTTQCTGVYGYTTSGNGYAMYSSGDFAASGAKAFLQPHPEDASRSIQFICLEGNENGTYFRGQARLVNGRAEIPIPEEWRLVSEADGITVQLTAVGSLTARVVVMEQGRDRIVVQGTEDCAFNYFVNGVRRGFDRYEPYIPNSAFRPVVRGVPFGTQYPKALRDILVRNGVLNPDYTPNESTAARLGWTLEDPDEVPPAGRWWLGEDERRRLIQASARPRDSVTPPVAPR